MRAPFIAHVRREIGEPPAREGRPPRTGCVPRGNKDSMADIMAFVSGKGGVGKTTTCTNVSAALSMLGRRVVMLELDAGFRCAGTLLRISQETLCDIGDVAKGRCSIDDALLLTNDLPHLGLLAAPASIDTTITRDELRDLIDALSPTFDTILIDAPAGAGDIVMAARLLSYYTAFVVTPDPVSVSAAAALHAHLTQPREGEFGLVINNVDIKHHKHNAIVDFDSIIDETRLPLLGVLPHDRDVARQTVLPNDCFFSEAVFNIANRLCGKYVPLIIQ